MLTHSKRSGRQLSRLVSKERPGTFSQDDAQRNVRAHLDDGVRAGIAHLTAVSATLRREISPSERVLLREATSHLKKLHQALSHAPGHAAKRARSREAPPADVALRQKLTELAAAEQKLAATHAQLVREVAERERLEKQHREAEHGLRDVRERFESAFGNAPIGMALIDMDDRWLQVNSALCSITGYTAAELKASTLRAITHPEDVDLDLDERQRLIAGDISNYHTEKRYRHAWGHHVWVLVTVSLVRNEKGGALYVITQVQDISQRRELAERLEYLVDHDMLTGLFNRRRFEQELSHETERATRYGHAGAVLMIDVDNFKDVNDTFGHAAGDDLLKAVAGTLKQRLRQTDVLARVGGDEFAVLLPGADADRAKIVADEIVKGLNRSMAVLADRSVHLTATVGVSLFDHLTDTEVLGYADLAMYEAKEAGRNRFALYQPSNTRGPVASARLAKVEQIRHALEGDRLLLYCQPIFDLHGSEVFSYELLLRLPDDAGKEPLSPDTFLYAAERSGLIQAVDAWVVRKAIALIAEHAHAGLRFPLHVNLSGKTIGDPKFVAFAEQTLTESGIDPALLIFELTETAAIASLEAAKQFTARLCSFGCGLALDDFGAGFGSFYYIKNFPFDYLKIDGAFIRGLGANSTDWLVVQALVNIAKGLGKKTVAEFVGNAETMRLVRELGVDYAQGYHIGQPRPVAELLAHHGESI